MKKLTLSTILALTTLMALGQSDIPRVYEVENTGSQLALPVMPEPDQLPVIRELPDALEGVTSFADWQKRRSDIAHMIQHYGIGEKPTVEASQVKARMEGDSALVVDVTVDGQTLTLRSVINYPKTGQPPYALMIGTSMISLPKQLFENRPIATMTYHESQVNDYSQWRPHHDRGEHNFDRLYPNLVANGAYSEWAWGLSRLIDGLQLLGSEVTKIDTRHIGVTGCSFAGKMALYCGAFDERVALTIAQVSIRPTITGSWKVSVSTLRAILSISCLTTSMSFARWFVRVPCCCWVIPTTLGWRMMRCNLLLRRPIRCGSVSASATVWTGALSVDTCIASFLRFSSPSWRSLSIGSYWRNKGNKKEAEQVSASLHIIKVGINLPDFLASRL